ncbi:MAG: biotin/lipoyl-binding protein [Chloroflexota bacterium]|nr:biotin/lipoyl-binding protein [Chloroflexota bacterium]
MTIDGLIAAQHEVPVSYQGSGKVLDIKVKPGQSVNEGDVLVELDAVELSRSLDAARARSMTARANLAQAQAQIAAQQRTAAQRAAAAQTVQQQAVADAQAGLKKAQDQLAVVMAGASDAEIHAAQNLVVTAQTALQRAQTAQDKLTAGPDPGVVRGSTADVANAQVSVDKAKSDLDALMKGADTVLFDQAQRELDRSATQLQLAQAMKPDPTLDPTSAKLAHDSAVADAQLAVQVAQDRLAKLKQPPSEIDVQSAKRRLANAQDVLTAATEKLNVLLEPADDSALAAAQTSVDLAQQAVDDAQARVTAIAGRPTRSEVTAAQDQVRRAQASLDAARSTPADATDPGGVDLTSLQDAVDQGDADVVSLQQQLDNSRIAAPISGTIVSIRAKPGDTITSAKPVIVMATAGSPVVRVQLSDDEASRLSAGQRASVQIDDGSGSAATAAATVATVTPTKGSQSAMAELSAQWPTGGLPRVGLPVQVSVTVQQKPQALVVPKTAVRSNGDKSYVEVVDGTVRRITPVQVGIASSDRVEIVSGLTEGQVVLLTP